MADSVRQIIYGEELRKYANFTDMQPDFVEDIDPEGISLVTLAFPHNDAMSEWRLFVMFKIKGKEEPIEGDLTITSYAYSRIVHSINMETYEVIH